VDTGRASGCELHALSTAAYRATHREETAAYQAAHREEIAAYNAAYRAAHREEIAAKKAAYQAAHREEIAARKAAWYENLTGQQYALLRLRGRHRHALARIAARAERDGPEFDLDLASLFAEFLKETG
jgi:hypothetical protein